MFILFTRERASVNSQVSTNNKESFVPISNENLKPPPYEDVFLMEYAKKQEKSRQNYEDDLAVNYNQEPIINDIPINIIYDNVSSTIIK
jgi:hypothetical protein